LRFAGRFSSIFSWGALNFHAAAAGTSAFDIQRATHLAPALIVMTGFCTFIDFRA
jgi:hypothetical protein